MSNNKTSVIILGIIAVAGLGLGGYMFVKNELLSLNSGVHTIWYDEVLDTAYFPPAGFTIDVPDLAITVTVNAGEKLFVLFNAAAGVSAVGADRDITVYFKFNDIQLSHPQATIGIEDSVIDHQVSLQYVDSSLTPGTYVITICIDNTYASSYLYDMTLMAFTYV